MYAMMLSYSHSYQHACLAITLQPVSQYTHACIYCIEANQQRHATQKIVFQEYYLNVVPQRIWRVHSFLFLSLSLG
jgi:hypothetical protein